MIVVRTQELAYIFEQKHSVFLFRIHSMFFSTICFSDIFCSKVAKWPNLSNLKNRENDSGSIPPFALPSDARRKKGKQAVLRPRRAA